MTCVEGVEVVGAGPTPRLLCSEQPNKLFARGGVINSGWLALGRLSWHSNLLNNLVSLSKHLPLVSLPIVWSKLRLRVILVHLHWVLASSATSDWVERWDSCYSWWLSPPRWLGDSGGSLSGFGDRCRLQSSDYKGILCSSPREIVKSNSSAIVVS